MYFRPKTLHQALAVLAETGSTIIAGGTDFFPALGERPASGPLVDISALDEIRGIFLLPETIAIGGAATWTELIAAPLPQCCDGLKQAARRVGSIQIQNRATVAGNLCNASPAADGVPPLLALDAEVELTSLEGARRMPLAEFVIGNRQTVRSRDEILTRILIPRTADQAYSGFAKLGARRYLVISIVMVAAVIAIDYNGRIGDARIAVGSCSARARRLGACERALLGQPVGPDIATAVGRGHLELLEPIDDARGTAAYRMDAALTLIRRLLENCATDGALESHV
ncbi:MAG TPA: FAD binding domain-containing protein [Candidatus Binataceae bacterium]|nr:FAD binding domain-containing protein [Candidatus Binataceae bacterium]